MNPAIEVRSRPRPRDRSLPTSRDCLKISVRHKELESADRCVRRWRPTKLNLRRTTCGAQPTKDDLRSTTYEGRPTKHNLRRTTYGGRFTKDDLRGTTYEGRPMKDEPSLNQRTHFSSSSAIRERSSLEGS